MGTTALRTDHYELTMADAAWRSGAGDRRAVFQVFARSLPDGRPFGVVAGVDPLLSSLERFVFDDDVVDWLLEAHVLSAPAAARLRGWRFDGDVDGYPEGELFAASSPVLTVVAPFAAGTLIETIVLSNLNHDSAVASAAAVMRRAAGSTPLIEMGSRRTDEHAAVAAARAAYIGGFDASSNLAARRRYGVPTTGTAAHSFTLAHAGVVGTGSGQGRDDDIELAAFAAQLGAQGPGTTLLVDTFDTERGIRNAVAAANAAGIPGPGAVRIDSGDLEDEARRARALLDDLGAPDTRIIVTSDVDEVIIEGLRAAGAPIDGFGVGSRVVSGSGHPSAGLVYKCTAVETEAGELVPVGKTSIGKGSPIGRTTAWRSDDPPVEWVVTGDRSAAVPPDARPVAVPLLRRGRRVDPADPVAATETARLRCASSLARLGRASLRSTLVQEVQP